MKSQRIIALVKPVGGADWVSFWLESALQLLFRTAAGSKTNRHKGIQERPRRGASCARGRATNVGQVPVRIRRRNGACHHLLRRGPDLDRNRRHDSLDPGPSDGRPRHPRLIFNGSRVRAGSPKKNDELVTPRGTPPPVLKKKCRSARALSKKYSRCLAKLPPKKVQQVDGSRLVFGMQTFGQHFFVSKLPSFLRQHTRKNIIVGRVFACKRLPNILFSGVVYFDPVQTDSNSAKI